MIIRNNSNKIYNQDLQEIYDNVIELLKPILDEFPEYALLTYGLEDDNLYYVKIKNKLYIYNNTDTSNPDIKDIYNNSNPYYFTIKKTPPFIETIKPSNYLDEVMYKDTFASYELELSQNETQLYIEGELVPEVHKFDLIYSDSSYNNIREILEKYITIPDTKPTSNLCDPNRVRSFPKEGPVKDPDGHETTAILSTVVKGNVGGLTTGEPIKIERTNNNIRIIGSFSMVRRNSSHICRDNDCSYYGFQPLFILGYKDNFNSISYYIPKHTISIKSSSNSLEIANRSNRITDDNRNSNYEILWLGQDIIGENGKPGYIEELYKEGVYPYGGDDPIHKEYFNFYELKTDGSIDFTKPKHTPGQFVIWSGVPFDKYNNSSFSINHSVEDLTMFSPIPQNIPGYEDAQKELLIPEIFKGYPAVYGFQPNETVGSTLNKGFVRFKIKSPSDYILVRYHFETTPGTPDANTKYNYVRYDGTKTYGYIPNVNSDFLPKISTDPGKVIVNLFKKEGDYIYFKIPTYNVLGGTIPIQTYNNKNTKPRIIFTARQISTEGFSIFNPDVIKYDHVSSMGGKFFAAEGAYPGGKYRQGGYLSGSFIHTFQVKYKKPGSSTLMINSTLKVTDAFETSYGTTLSYMDIDISQFSKISTKYNNYKNQYRFRNTFSSDLEASKMHGTNYMRIPFDIYVSGTPLYNGILDREWKVNGVSITAGSNKAIACHPDVEAITEQFDVTAFALGLADGCTINFTAFQQIKKYGVNETPGTLYVDFSTNGAGCENMLEPYSRKNQRYMLAHSYKETENISDKIEPDWEDEPSVNKYDWYPFLTLEVMRKKRDGTYVPAYDVPNRGRIVFWNDDGSMTTEIEYDNHSFGDIDPGIYPGSSGTYGGPTTMNRINPLDDKYSILCVDKNASREGTMIFITLIDTWYPTTVFSDLQLFPVRLATRLGYKGKIKNLVLAGEADIDHSDPRTGGREIGTDNREIPDGGTVDNRDDKDENMDRYGYDGPTWQRDP